MAAADSLPYHEPNITTILILSSFLILLNAINFMLDQALYCGLVGQVLLGVAWGTPGAKWLADVAEKTIVQLGYLGLILLVYKGGLSTSFVKLKANLLLSVFVALTGISFPVAFSFVLKPLANATSLQSFAAGAALCSTSLGTTLTVINTSGLSNTRLGVVLTSAAMMDDVVGLVMVQVISDLGGNGHTVAPSTIVKPIFVSLAFTILLPILCRCLVKPSTIALNRIRGTSPNCKANQILARNETMFAIHTTLLAALVTGASYAGTSNLFAAYLGGITISWWDIEVPHVKLDRGKGPPRAAGDSPQEGHTDRTLDSSMRPSEQPAALNLDPSSRPASLNNGVAIYERYYQQAVERILKPFFFASIGFSIPISRMFSATVVWKGVVYALLMAVGKLACGAWLIRISFSAPQVFKICRTFKVLSWLELWGCRNTREARSTSGLPANPSREDSAAVLDSQNEEQSRDPDPIASLPDAGISAQKSELPSNLITSRSPRKPISLYPSAILGSAMVARGEIGFLISSLAQSNGIFSSALGRLSSDIESEIFLMTTWAIVLCTLVGPLCVGLLVRRTKRLEKTSASSQANAEQKRDVLGVWGVR